MTYEFSLGVNVWKSFHNARHNRGAKILLIPGFWTGDQGLYPLAWRLRAAGQRHDEHEEIRETLPPAHTTD